jgi:hypothetical protein
MSMTMTRGRRDRHQPVDPPRFLGNVHRRRPVVAIASLVLVTFCVAIFTSMYLHAGNRVAVLALAHNVPQGHAITRKDLIAVRISLSAELSPIPAEDVGGIVGRMAVVPLLRGTLLSPSELTVRGGPAPGEAIVGVATKVGQLPAGGVGDGDTVDVILTGSPSTLTGEPSESAASTSTSGSGSDGPFQIGGVLARNATVTGVATPTSSSPDTIVVSVLIPASLAPLVASASAGGQAALALVGPSS